MLPWEISLLVTCRLNNIEPVRDSENTMLIFSPKSLDDNVKENLRKIIPTEYDIQYRTNVPYPSTISRLAAFFSSRNIQCLNLRSTSDNGLEIIVKDFNPKPQEIEIIKSIFATDLYVKKFTLVKQTETELISIGTYPVDVKLNLSEMLGGANPNFDQTNKPISNTYGKEFEKRQAEGQYFSKSDIVDVKIALGQAETVDDFLKVI